MYNFKKSFKHDGYFRTLIIYGIMSIFVGILLFSKYNVFYIYIWPFLIFITAIVGFIARIHILKNFMKTAKIADGKVLRTHYYRGSKIVNYEFNFKGKTFKGRAKLNYNKDNKYVEKDAQIKLAFDPKRPSRSYIYDLYFDE